jgi:hypothetical protein
LLEPLLACVQGQEVVARVAAVRGAVASQGWARLPSISGEAFLGIARELGDVIDDTPVRLAPGRRTYLTSPGAIPLHTDHSNADLVAWWCETQDERDGATLLADGREVTRGLDIALRRVLARTLLPAMRRLGDEPVPTAVLSDVGDRAAVFYAPWLTPMAGDPDVVLALRILGRTVERVGQTAHRLQAGEVLIVDNHRMLHGRGPLLLDSARRLRRLWLRSPGP